MLGASRSASSTDVTLKIGNTGRAIQNGVVYQCFGPFPLPAARKLYRFLPEVDMGILHHMIMYGGRAGTPCGGGRIWYAWARTGQSEPIGLNFEEHGSGLGYEVGRDFASVSLQVHYQQLRSATPVADYSGVRLWFAPVAPTQPLQTTIILSYKINIPPRTYYDECVVCRVRRGGTVVAWRNHAHRLARDVWSDHLAPDGRRLPPIGNLSAQEPQIIRFLPQPVTLAAGSTLQLHCMYDARNMTSTTRMGADERYYESALPVIESRYSWRAAAAQSHSLLGRPFSPLVLLWPSLRRRFS